MIDSRFPAKTALVLPAEAITYALCSPSLKASLGEFEIEKVGVTALIYGA